MVGKLLFVMERYCDANPAMGPTNSESQLVGAVESTGLVGQVKRFYFDDLGQRRGKAVMAQLLFQDCEVFRPDLVIYTPIQGPLGEKLNPPDAVMVSIRAELGIKVHTHLWDTVADDAHVLSRLPYSDTIGVVDSVVGQRFAGNPRIVQSYPAVDPRYFHDKGLERDIDVSFVGPLSSPNRVEGVNFLRANGINVVVAGGQRTGRLSWEEYAGLMQRSKISLNFSCNPYDGSSQMKARALEVMTCAAMLMEEDGEHTKRFFEAGRELVIFSSPEDLLVKVEHYLTSAKKRIAIALSGWRKVSGMYNARNCWGYLFKRLNFEVPEELAEDWHFQQHEKQMAPKNVQRSLLL